MFGNFFKKTETPAPQQEAFGLAGLTKPKETLANPALAGLEKRQKELEADLKYLTIAPDKVKDEIRAELAAIEAQKKALLGGSLDSKEAVKPIPKNESSEPKEDKSVWAEETLKKGANANNVFEFKKQDGEPAS